MKSHEYDRRLRFQIYADGHWTKVMEMVKLRLELIPPSASTGAIDNIIGIWMYPKT